MNHGANAGTASDLSDDDEASDAELDRRTSDLEQKIRELEKQKRALKFEHQLSLAILISGAVSTPVAAPKGTPQSALYLAMKARRDAKAKKGASQKDTPACTATANKTKGRKK